MPEQVIPTHVLGTDQFTFYNDKVPIMKVFQVNI